MIDIRDPRRSGEMMAQAFHAAGRSQPGPVIVAGPEDMLAEEVEAPPVPVFSIGSPQACRDPIALVAASLAAVT